MSTDSIVVLSILGVASVLFVTEWLRADVVALLVAVSLVMAGVLTPEAALSGFSSNAVIAIAALLVIGKAMVRSGVVGWLAERLHGVVRGSRLRLALVGTTAPGILSGVINIIAAVSIFIPAIQRLSRKTGVAPSRLLLPMAAACLAGANLTLIGASHNLVVNSLLDTAGVEGFGFFEFTPFGVVLFAAVVLYCLIPGRWLLPREGGDGAISDRPEGPDLLELYGIEESLWEIWIAPGAAAVGETVGTLRVGRGYGLAPVIVLREERQLSVESDDFRLEANDVLAVIGRAEQVDALAAATEGVVVLGRPDLDDEFSWTVFQLAEVTVPPRSDAVGKSLRELELRHDTQLSGIALWRQGRPVRAGVQGESLCAGDGVLLFGTREAVRRFDPAPHFLWVTRPAEAEAPPKLRKLGPVALGVLLLVIAVAALGWLPVSVAAATGAAVVVIAGILSPRRAYRSIDWKTVVIVAGMYPVGRALELSGAAADIAGLLVQVVGSAGPLAVMGGIAALSMLLTQVLHNAVVAVVMTPVAIQSAAAMGTDHKAFAMAVIAGASATFLLPVGHPAVMLVQRPGGYTLRDYLKFGAGLVGVVAAVLLTVAPVMWPFR